MVLDSNIVKKVKQNSILSDVDDISSKIIEIVANRMIDLGEQDNDHIKWREAINKTVDNETDINYFTGQRGMASIGLSFLELYKSTLNKTYLDVAEKTINYIIKRSILTDKGIVFPRSEKSPFNWTDYRYGNAGIIPFFINFWKITGDLKYIEIAKEAGNYLVNIKQTNETNYAWWLTAGDSGFITTDFYYGTAGIVDTLLDIYSTSNKTEYLVTALEGANWLKSLIRYTDQSGLSGYIQWAITNSSYFSSLKYTGLLSGQAGIGKVFLKLFNLTEDSQWLKTAQVLGSWIKKQDVNDTGLYSFPGTPYLTNRDENAKNILGLSDGNLGILDFYLDLYEYDNNELWLFEVIRIIQSINSSLVRTPYGEFLPYEAELASGNEFFTSIFYGNAGLVKIISRLITLFSYDEHILMLKNILDTFYNLTLFFNGYIPPKFDVDYINTNGETGLAGIILGLISIKSINNDLIGKYHEKYLKALIDIPEPELTFMTTSVPFYTNAAVLIFYLFILGSRKLVKKT